MDIINSTLEDQTIVIISSSNDNKLLNVICSAEHLSRLGIRISQFYIHIYMKKRFQEWRLLKLIIWEIFLIFSLHYPSPYNPYDPLQFNL